MFTTCPLVANSIGRGVDELGEPSDVVVATAFAFVVADVNLDACIVVNVGVANEFWVPAGASVGT